MKKRVFLGAWLASPLIPILVYALRFESFANLFFLSVAFGLAAYTYLCSLFLLAARPGFIPMLGEEEVRSFLARKLPVLVVLFGLGHRILKIGILPPFAEAAFWGVLDTPLVRGLSFSPHGPSAILGSVGFLALLGGLVVGAFIVLPRLGRSRIGVRLRSLLDSYPVSGGHRELAVYGALVCLGGVFLAHVLMASSTSFSANPLGATLVLVEFLVPVIFYGAAKLREILQVSRSPASS